MSESWEDKGANPFQTISANNSTNTHTERRKNYGKSTNGNTNNHQHQMYSPLHESHRGYSL